MRQKNAKLEKLGGMLVAVFLMLSCLTVPVKAAEISGLDAVSVTGGTENASAATITGSHSNKSSTSTTTTTMTLTGDGTVLGETQGTLSFDVTYTLTGPSKIGGTDGKASISATSGLASDSFTGSTNGGSSKSGSGSVTIENWGAGSSWTITMSASAAKGGLSGYSESSVSVTISNISFAAYSTESVTFKGTDTAYAVTYYADATATDASTITIPANSAGIDVEANLTKGLTISADDYYYCTKVQAQRDGTTTALTMTNGVFYPTNGDVITPTLVQDWDKDGVAPFLVNSEKYWTWDDAMVAGSSGTVVLNEDYTLPSGFYNIPSGITLLIPFDAANTLYTSAPVNEIVDDPFVQPTAYRTLTLASGAQIEVNGGLSVSGKHSTIQGYNGSPIGPVGFIRMGSDSSITVKKGGSLYAWGYVLGSGTVTIESGGTVYEYLQISAWRGGNATNKLNSDKKTFPFSQYYIQNIEVPLTLNAGATEKIYTTISVGASSLVWTEDALETMIGSNAGMFRPSSGSITRTYDGSTDRVTYDINGTVSMSNLSVTINAMGLGNITMDSANFHMPINSNITVNVNNGHSITVANNVEMLPGAVLNVDSGATVTLGTDVSLVAYDQSQWSTSYCSTAGGANSYYPIRYAPGKTYNRQYSDLVDAAIQVNGTLDASAGYLRTTTSGANIYSTDSGVVKMRAGENATVYQYKQLNSAYDEITVTSAQLKNADGSYRNSATDTYTYANGVWNCTNHTPGDAATCTTAQMCTVCEAEITPALGHTTEDTDHNHICDREGCTGVISTCKEKATKTEAVAATCQNEGNIAYWTCSVCSKMFSDEACTIEVTNVTIEKDAENHTNIVTDAAVDSTCTAEGKTEGSHCADCNAVIVAQEAVSATGHTYSDWTQTKAPTCTEKGEEMRTCSCGESETREVAALGHADANKDHVCDNGCNVVQGTHEAAAGKHTCDYCGKAVTTCEASEQTTTYAPTESGKHTVTVTCSVCSASISSTTEACADDNDDFNCDKCGGLLVNAYTDAVTIAEGCNGSKSVDGATVTLKYTGELPFAQGTGTDLWANWAGFKITAPTGLDMSKITIQRPDGATRVMEKIKDGDNYAYLYWGMTNDEDKQATYQIDWNGDQTYDLTVILDTSEAKLLECTHSYGEWEVTEEATTTEVGSKSRTCSACKHVETKEIPKVEVTLAPVENMTGTTPIANVAEPTNGWQLGENTFTVSCDKACVVVYTTTVDGETVYHRLSATATEDVNTYGFNVTLAEDTKVVVAIKGDVNSDAKVNASDTNKINKYIITNSLHEDLSDFEYLMADLTGDTRVNASDANIINKFIITNSLHEDIVW